MKAFLAMPIMQGVFYKYRLFLFFFMLLFAVRASYAATYYISPTGNNSATGDSAHPFRTIQRAADIVNPGDTVIVKDGTYTDANGDGKIVIVRRGGSSGNWVTFKSENKWGAVLDGQNFTTSYGFLFDGTVNYVRVEGFEIKKILQSAINIDTISVSNVYFCRNKIHDIGRLQFTCNNYLSKYGKTGFAIGETTSYSTIDSNVLYNIGRLPGGCPAQDFALDHGLYIRGSHGTITNNIFYDIKAGWGVQFYNSNTAYTITDWKVINNTFYNGVHSADSSRSGQVLTWYRNAFITIENNIFHTPGDYAIWNQDPNIPGVTVRNNLLYGTSNLYLYNAPGFRVSGNIVGQDPKFVDLGKRDFRLKTGSPAIDKGIDTMAPDHDGDGNQRPQNKYYDIGAYEFIFLPQ